MVNQTPEQQARDNIDALLTKAGWAVQDKSKTDFAAAQGVALHEYQTDVGPADYALFVDKQAVGIIEAKPETWGERITTIKEQSQGYANAKLKWINNQQALRFVYESTGIITRFTDALDPNPRSREVFNFHRPETLANWLRESKSLRGRMQAMPPLNTEGLRDCQISAITNLEKSLKEDKPRALIQMATGSGKTFTAITASYRLLKEPVSATRILFLVDTKNLGEQAEQEFMTFVPNDDNRKFTELYSVQRLKSSHISTDSQVYISTIQRMYAMLKDEPLDEWLEEQNPAEKLSKAKEPLPVVYNEYIYYYLKASKELAESRASGTTFLEISGKAFGQLPVPLPQEEEQKRIVTKIEELFSELDSGIASLKTAREQLKIYRQAVLKHAFEGKLTAQWRKENANQLETPEQLLARIQQEREARYQQQLNDWKQAVKDWEEEGKEGKKPAKPTAIKKPTVLKSSDLTVPSNWAVHLPANCLRVFMQKKRLYEQEIKQGTEYA